MGKIPEVTRSNATAEPTSEQLARRAQLGEHRPIEELLGRHQHEVYRVALRLLGNCADADEVVQAVLERVVRHLHTYDATRPFRPWVLRITVNRARTFLRRRMVRELFLGRTPVAAAAETEAAAAPDWHLRRKELSGELERALMQLPLASRRAFVLKHVEGLAYEEIAEITGESVGGLKVRVHRARRALAAALERGGVTPSRSGE